MFECKGRNSVAAKHTGKLAFSVFAAERTYPGKGCVFVRRVFRHTQVYVAKPRNMGKVGYARILLLSGYFAQFAPDGACRFAADVGVDFVKNQSRHLVVSGDNIFYCQHNT